MKTTLALIAALGLALPAAPALAQNEPVDIKYKDLDLATPEGQAKLDRRIDKAARKACGADQSRTGTRIAKRDVTACVAAAKRQASQQMAAIIEQEKRGG